MIRLLGRLLLLLLRQLLAFPFTTTFVVVAAVGRVTGWLCSLRLAPLRGLLRLLLRRLARCLHCRRIGGLLISSGRRDGLVVAPIVVTVSIAVTISVG